MASDAPLPISVIVPAFRRVDHLVRTLEEITRCEPRPAEILVHVDGASPEIIRVLGERFPSVRVSSSTELGGPGGSRNRLVKAASQELIANFDDDSYPRHHDFFARVMSTAAAFPHAAIISASGLDHEESPAGYRQLPEANGCGSIFRKSWYEATGGFVPLPVAYCMEEVDMAIRLFDLGGAIIHDTGLRVVHDHERNAEEDRKTVPIVFANTVLFCFLRYPVILYPIASWHVFRHAAHLVRQGWWHDLWKGVQLIPSHLIQWRAYRKTVRPSAVFRWLQTRRHPVSVLPESTSIATNTL